MIQKIYKNGETYVEVDGSKEIHEIKGSHLMNRETELKMNAAKLYCEARKMTFRLITK